MQATSNHTKHTKDSNVACITGSAKRIGAKIAQDLHQLGYRIIIHYHHSEDEANQLCNQLNERRANSAASICFDLNKTNDLWQFGQHIIGIFGRLDVLIHNASRFYPTTFKDATLTQWHEIFGSNTLAPFFLSQAVACELHANHGCIISLLDIHANDRPFKGYCIYNMAKAAHRMMVKSLSLELSPNIRVNGVAPGANIWPENHSDQAINKKTQNSIINSVPLQSIGSPHDISQAVIYLISASYVTGHVLTVDGGRSLTLAGDS